LIVDAVKIAAVVFVAAILQVSIFSGVTILGGTPDLLLVTLVAVAVLRGSIVGAVAGFAAGLLVDVANLEILGMTSLLLTLGGYWIGRYGETTARDRTHSPFLAVAVVTVLYSLGVLGLRFMLGEPAPARVVLLETLFQGIVLNLVLTWPVYALVKRLLPPRPRPLRPEGVPAVG
jgi:rod shape-determining protein MreD